MGEPSFSHTLQTTKARGSARFTEVINEEDEKHWFTFYYTSDPIPIMGYDPHKLSTTKRESIELLEKFHVIKVHDLFK